MRHVRFYRFFSDSIRVVPSILHSYVILCMTCTSSCIPRVRDNQSAREHMMQCVCCVTCTSSCIPRVRDNQSAREHMMQCVCCVKEGVALMISCTNCLCWLEAFRFNIAGSKDCCHVERLYQSKNGHTNEILLTVLTASRSKARIPWPCHISQSKTIAWRYQTVGSCSYCTDMS